MNTQILEAVNTKTEEQSGLLINGYFNFSSVTVTYDAEFRMANIRGEKVSLKSN